MEDNTKKNLQAILWVLLNNFVMACQTAIIKNLTFTMHKFQVVMLYKLTVVLCLLPFFFKNGVKSFKTKNILLLMANIKNITIMVN
jgi:hypothetical protein